MSRFSETLLEHCQSPRHRGPLADATVTGSGSLQGTPPFVTVALKVEAGRIARAAFEAAGCGVTIACGSVLTELVEGLSVDECGQIDAARIVAALDGLPADKHYCAWVAAEALRDALLQLHLPAPETRPPRP